MAFSPTPDGELISVDEHVRRILEAIEPLPPYDQPLLEALGLPVCETITAPVNLPVFDNSAMDGYAVVHSDLAGATPDTPASLPVVGESAAGAAAALALSPGTAVKIMTGAPVPQGATAVVPVEWTDAGVAQVRINRAPQEGQHIRLRGEDVQIGDRLMEDGTILGPRQIGLLASVGRAQVRSRPRPRVVILSTGSELRDPGTKLTHDTIYDANSFTIAAAVRNAGALAYRVGIVSDDPTEFFDALSDQLVRADLVVTSGGVSKGEYDVVKDVLSRLGTVWFGEVAMQPGKPQGFGRVGEDSTPIFALPGNPVSSYISFEAFVLPAIRKLMGRLPYQRPIVRVRSSATFRSIPRRQQFVRARFAYEGGSPAVAPVGGQGSHLMGGLSAANALIVVPPDTEIVHEGDLLDVLVLDRDF